MATERIWSYREPAWRAGLAGYGVTALDGDLGKVDEATDETRGGYVIVDAGPWFFRKKVMLPAGVIDSVDREARRIYVNRTRHEVANAPKLNEAHFDDDAYRVALGRYYGLGGAGFREPSAGASASRLHARETSDR